MKTKGEMELSEKKVRRFLTGRVVFCPKQRKIMQFGWNRCAKSSLLVQRCVDCSVKQSGGTKYPKRTAMKCAFRTGEKMLPIKIAEMNSDRNADLAV